VLYGTFARSFSTPEELEARVGYINQAWGSGGILQKFGPSRQNDPAVAGV
jgi:hypothetical protein